MKARKIIHLDLDAFFCAVEEIRHPELRGRPFAVGGKADERGVVSSCSYPARKFGVHSAMPMAKALRLCPGLITVQTDHHEYHQASQKTMALIHELTPLVEQVSIDEAFFDVSDMPESMFDLATGLQKRIKSELNLPCSLGAATNKLVAKIANNIGKSSKGYECAPCAITIVSAGQEAAFLAPLPVRELWGVGPKSAAKLEAYGIHTIGELAQQNEIHLRKWFGKWGEDMLLHARGIDESAVVESHETKSISQELTYSRDVADIKVIEKTIRELAEDVGRRLRQEELGATTVKIKIRWPDFSTQTRQVSFPEMIDQDGVIFQAAMQLFSGLWQHGKRIRLIGVGVSGLQKPAYQLSLWDTPTEKQRRLMAAIDAVKDRFGTQAVQRANGIKKQ